MSLKYKLSGIMLNTRRKHNLTQSETAAALGVSTRWYQKLEAGKKFPGGKLLLKIIIFFDIDIKVFKEECGINVSIHNLSRELIHK